ncbi:MAG: crossover junction endodeoxyribonuclease RuvC [Bacteroidetes bacterium]|nr:MAG: crossover junction endodeoxyribonuclease RuvC [Bacteroidota bacterium]
MIILGIDPGTVRMGYAVVQCDKKQPKKVLSIGYIDLTSIPEHPEKLKVIYEKLDNIITQYRPDEVAIELPFYGKNVQSMLKLGRAQGIAMAVAFAHQLPVAEYSPKKIKLSITGNGNASKEQVAGVLKNIVAFDYSEKYYDATDALAVAIGHCFQINYLVQNLQLKKTSTRQKQSWKRFIEKNPERTI